MTIICRLKLFIYRVDYLKGWAFWLCRLVQKMPTFCVPTIYVKYGR